MEAKEHGQKEEKECCYRALVIDNLDFSRRQITNALAELDIEMVGELTSAREAVKVISQTNANIIIFDIVMPDSNGIELIHKFSNHLDEKHFIVVSYYYQELIIVEAIKSGAVDFLQKPLNKNLLIQSVLKVQQRIDKGEGGQKSYG